MGKNTVLRPHRKKCMPKFLDQQYNLECERSVVVQLSSRLFLHPFAISSPHLHLQKK